MSHRYLTITVTRHFRQQQLSKQLPLVDTDQASRYSIKVYYQGTSSYQRDQGILNYFNFRIGESNSSRRIYLRLAELSPIRINAEETLKISKKDKLNLRLTLNEEDKKDLIIISYNPIINSGKYYINEKVKTKRIRITSNIVNYILNSQNYSDEINYNYLIIDYYFDYYSEIDSANYEY